YKVTAVDTSSNESDPSAQASATTEAPPPPPTMTAYYCDVDTMSSALPMTVGGNLNSKTEATGAQYTAIGSSDDSRWTTPDPGYGDEVFLWLEMYTSMAVETIGSIELHFEGYLSSESANFSIWARDLVNGEWDQIGTTQSIATGADGTITRTITANIANYIAADGKLIWGVYESADSRSLNIDYVYALFIESAPDTTPPAAPTGLTATAVSSSQIDLDWANNTEGDLDHYNVYRSTTSGFTPGPGNFVTERTVSNYSDTGLSASTTYYYKVTAVDTSNNESNPSAQASATTEAPADTTPPAAPTGLTATAVSSSQINLDWNNNTEGDLDHYNVYRSTTSGFTPGPGTFVAERTVSSYSDTGLSASTTYYYKVTAVDTSNNESNPSAQASATTEAAPPPPTGAWDFECHSYTHPDAITASELQQVNDAFAAHGLPEPLHHAYPFGNVNQSVCSQYRLSGRTVGGIMETQYPVPNWYQLKATEIQAGTAWSTIKGWVDQCISQVGLLTIFSHWVQDPAPQYGMTPTMLHQLLDYLVDRQNAGQLTVRTIRDAYNAWNGTSPIVVVSFDDGWLSDYDNVWPLFNEHGLVGTSYIYPYPMDDMWSDFMGWAQVEEMAGLREPRPEPGPSITHAGCRQSSYGISPFPDAEEWETDMKAMASYWPGSQPTGIWIVGTLQAGGTDCYLEFPSDGGNYDYIVFDSTDRHESYLDYFDTHGIDVWLQVEPGFADMNTLIDLVLNRYGSHSCVKGVGVDCEWYRYTEQDNWGVPVTNSNAQSWESRVKSHNSNYTLFLKHFNYTWLPPDYRGDIIFVDDSQEFNQEDYWGLPAMVSEFTVHWAPWFYPNPVWFQIGYPADQVWWDELANPPKNIGDAIDAETTQATGIVWVDFTLRDVFPPGGDTTPPAAPTGLTATAVSSSQINLDWNNNTEGDLSHYHVYRSTTSGFTPGTGTFVADTSVSNYSNTGLSASTTYYYKVTAVDTSVNESSPSAQASATTEEGAPPMMHAGVRASSYGISPFPDAEEWETDMKAMASYWPGSQPTGIWLVGLMEPPDVLGSSCHLEFPEPAGGPYQNITFESTDLHESYFDYFDTHGIDVWLQVEPGDANMNTLIDLVLDQYGHHSCVKGFGLDVEWYTTTGASVTDSNAQSWESRVKSHNSSYTLFIKFWNIDRTPPSYRGDIIFVDDSQQFSSLAEMVSEFANYWAPEFYPNPVWFQYGYEADRGWWQNLTNPPKDIGDALDAAVPQECGLFWVDFTLRDVFPPGGDTTPPAAPTGLTATAVSSSQINLDWNNNTEGDLSHYHVYRSTTSGFTPGPGNFVAETTVSNYSNTGLSASTTYYYKVTAVDTSNNESSPSAQASATTQEGPPPPPPGGWDFECHSYTHPYLTSLTADQIRSQMQQVNASFQANLGYTPQHHSYPYGEFNSTVKSVVAEYRLSGRAAWAYTGSINTYPMADWYQMNAVEIQASTAVSTITGYIDYAISNNALLNIFTHRVMDPAPQYGCTPATLRAVCSYLLNKQNAGQLQVLPIRDAYTSWNGTKAVVVLGFDDGWKTDYTTTWGIVSGEYGFVGTSYIYPDAQDGQWADFLSWAEVQAMAAG
ncbi:MAG: fibronectin type III domain-containing protein, partial [Hadesarchaea archaeon]|nr:fibronectin type III domain-containing protein [Hadesarchaea archaeon]